MTDYSNQYLFDVIVYRRYLSIYPALCTYYYGVSWDQRFVSDCWLESVHSLVLRFETNEHEWLSLKRARNNKKIWLLNVERVIVVKNVGDNWRIFVLSYHLYNGFVGLVYRTRRESEKNSMELCISKQLFFLYEVYSGFFWKKDWVTTVCKKVGYKGGVEKFNFEFWLKVIFNCAYAHFRTKTWFKYLKCIALEGN